MYFKIIFEAIYGYINVHPNIVYQTSNAVGDSKGKSS